MSKALRGEVWQTRFWPSVGAEISKERPAVVISSQKAGRLPLSIVVPVTDWKDNYSNYFWFVRLAPSTENGLSKVSGADAFQVKSISDERLMRKIGELQSDEVREIAFAVRFCVGA
jgi:mRNA interferase MazF